MSSVLGTEIRVGAAAASAVLISDLHVRGGAGADEELAPLRAAISVAQQRADALFVLGDLFDSYVSRAQIRVGVWRDVAELLRGAVQSGLRVVVLVGNRDFLLGDEFVRASGVELVPGGYRLPLAGVDTLFLHGDELCQNDLPYQKAKRWLRHPATRWLARRLPLSLAQRAAAKARTKSQNVIQSGDQTRFLPSRRAIDAAFATGVQRLVFGHIHRHARGLAPTSDGAAEYHVLPAFDVDGVGLMIGPDGWHPMRFRQTPDDPSSAGKAIASQAEPVAVPAACDWSA